MQLGAEGLAMRQQELRRRREILDRILGRLQPAARVTPKDFTRRAVFLVRILPKNSKN